MFPRSSAIPTRILIAMHGICRRVLPQFADRAVADSRRAQCDASLAALKGLAGGYLHRDHRFRGVRQ